MMTTTATINFRDGAFIEARPVAQTMGATGVLKLTTVTLTEREVDLLRDILGGLTR